MMKHPAGMRHQPASHCARTSGCLHANPFMVTTQPVRGRETADSFVTGLDIREQLHVKRIASTITYLISYPSGLNVPSNVTLVLPLQGMPPHAWMYTSAISSSDDLLVPTVFQAK